MTRLSTSPPVQQPPGHCQSHGQATVTVSPRRPSPMSLVDFSFTQLFASLDETVPEQQHATTEANAAAPATAISAESTLLSVAMSRTAKSLTRAVHLSLHDCVLLKLSLTCALCGCLLRRHPAAIETCGHCFCYDCINDALENGCTPLMLEWPWCTLEKEVGAAEVRWAAASVASTSGTSLRRRAVAETLGWAAQVTGESSDGHAHRDEVQVPTHPGTRTKLSRCEPPSRQRRKPRKVRHLCPLCLGPAFKWMLVPLQPLADLCNSLSSAYPGLEEALGQLTASSLDSANSVTASPEAPAERDETGGEIDSDAQVEVPPASTSAILLTAAFAPHPSLPGAEDQRTIQGEEGDAQDEEAERRRRRSSGGPRKEITFAVNIASRVPSSSTAVTANVPATANHTSDPVADVLCAAHSAGAEAIEKEASSSAEADEQGSGGARTAVAAALQLSADLIPSPRICAPSLFAAATRAPRDTLSLSTCQCGAEVSVLNPTQLCRDDVLGNSPADTSDNEDAHLGGKESEDAVAPLRSAPASQHAMAALNLSHVAADANSSQSSFPFSAPGNPLLLLDAVATVPDEHSVSWSVVMSQGRKEAADRLTPPSTHLPVLLDSIDTALHARASSMPGWSVMWDGDNVRELSDESGCDEDCPTTAALASRCSYSTVRFAEVRRCEGAVGEKRCGNGDVNHEHRRPAPTGALSRVIRHFSGAELASVHAQDIWGLDTALVRRHTRLPSCFAVLRHGRVLWPANKAAEEDGSDTAAGLTYSDAEHPPPPILCVVGQYPQQSRVPCRSASSGLHLPVLTPTACTALVLGVPCVDITCISSPISSPEPAHAVCEWQSSTTVVAEASLPTGRERHDLKAFQKACKRQTGASSASFVPQRRAGPRPGSWMATTPQALLARLHPTTSARGTRNGVDATVTDAAQDTYLCFLLPDGATRQLSVMLYHQWTRGESSQSQQTEASSPLAPVRLSSASRKRCRDAVHDSGVTHGIGHWSATDGHPQRAWRRLLLVAGGAAVELSWTLFEVLVATAAALEGGDSAADKDLLVNSLAAHLQHRGANDTHSLWVHVDVADCQREPSLPAANSVDFRAAQHTLLLLYSMAIAREVFTQMVEKDVCEKSPRTPSSASASLSPSSGERDTPRTYAFVQRFKTFLDRLAALVALTAAPVLPERASAHGSASPRGEARPSSWLLESIAQGRCTVDGNVTASPPSKTLEAVGDHTAASITTNETHSRDEPAAMLRYAASFPMGESDERQGEEAAPPPRQQAGRYRRLLYTDTP
ncbi:hypothetical protein CUR178_00821 [Leishmania enriettii]|uniref:RING-type domain-containing protein n=1 Tax=Leishmania enriettii TaxID=5663 RepID=A0A836KDU7_LEIEN|nr:hypothetical protein CUR178_00821 [Leishmania enriettii]